MSSVSNNIKLVRKYPHIFKWIKENPWPPYQINSIFFDPCENFIKWFMKNFIVDDVNTNYISDMYLEMLSSHPSNEAIDLMIKYPALIDLRALILNTNPRVVDILEEYTVSIMPYYWDTMSLSENPTVLSFLGKHLDKIHWIGLSTNECDEAVCILEKNLDKINWTFLCSNKNPKAMEILEKNLEKLEQSDWKMLVKNPSALGIFQRNMDKFMSLNPCTNPNPLVFEMIEQTGNEEFINKLFNHCYLSTYSGASNLILANLTKVNWSQLSSNSSDVSIQILMANQEKINFSQLSFNTHPGAINLLMENPDSIDLNAFLQNPSILYNQCAISYVEAKIAQINSNPDEDAQYWATTRMLQFLGENPNCIPLLEKLLGTGKISQDTLYNAVAGRNQRTIREFMKTHSSMFDLDYQAMSKNRMDIIREELLIKTLLRPVNIITEQEAIMRRTRGMREYEFAESRARLESIIMGITYVISEETDLISTERSQIIELTSEEDEELYEVLNPTQL